LNIRVVFFYKKILFVNITYTVFAFVRILMILNVTYEYLIITANYYGIFINVFLASFLTNSFLCFKSVDIFSFDFIDLILPKASKA